LPKGVPNVSDQVQMPKVSPKIVEPQLKIPKFYPSFTPWELEALKRSVDAPYTPGVPEVTIVPKGDEYSRMRKAFFSIKTK